MKYMAAGTTPLTLEEFHARYTQEHGYEYWFGECRNYERIGIPQIFVFDPESKTAWEWSTEEDSLERMSTLRLRNGSTLDIDQIWTELEARMRIS